MILDRYVDVIVYYEKDLLLYTGLNYKCVKYKPFSVKIEDLKKTSTSIINCQCSKCFKKVKREYRKYLSNKNKYYFGCSIKCCLDKKIITNLKKYGVKHFLQSEETRLKIKETCLKKYGVENVLQSDCSKEKTKLTLLKRYGVDSPLKNKDILNKVKQTNLKRYNNVCSLYGEVIKEKVKQTNLERYGFENVSQNKEIKNKMKNTCLERYGFEYIFQSKEIRSKSILTNLKKYGTPYYIQSNYYKQITLNIKKDKFIKLGLSEKNLINIGDLMTIYCDKCKKEYSETSYLIYQRLKYFKTVPCTNCNPISSSSSSGKELELLKFIKNNYSGKVLENDRKVLEGKELDIYLPDLGLAFEFNGVYWHSEKFKENNYHLKKTENCLKKNIHLIHIYEDDWNYKQNIVKSRILNMLGKSENILSSKCIIKEVSSSISKEFLIDNHLKGSIKSDIRLGLYYKVPGTESDILVSLMLFNIKGNFELLRFCNLLNTNVIRSESLLFKRFINNYSLRLKDIISYVDRSWYKGQIQENLGFKFIKNIKPNYLESDILRNNRIYNSGYIKFLYIIKN